MGYLAYWQSLSPRALNVWIHTFSLIAIFFEGYDQGVMVGLPVICIVSNDVDVQGGVK